MIDTHCHLQDLRFEMEIERARQAGVTTLVCNGYDLESSKKGLQIAETYDTVCTTVGIHPEKSPSTSLSSSLEQKFLELATHPKVVAIGESGLDNPDSAQIELFEWHIQLAKKARLPLVIHCRNVFAEIYQRIGLNPIRVQMHCWTGSWDWAKKFLDLGCYLSFGGIVTFKSSHELREVVKKVPTDRLVIETDSPYISPEPLRGKPNSPANLPLIAKVIARVRGISMAKLDEITAAAAYSLFPKLNLLNQFPTHKQFQPL